MQGGRLARSPPIVVSRRRRFANCLRGIQAQPTPIPPPELGERRRNVHANVVSFQMPMERLDEGIQMFKERVAPTMRQHAGFKGHYLLVDRQGGKLVDISLWETEANAAANTAALAVLRTQGGQRGGAPPTAERFEVISQQTEPTPP